MSATNTMRENLGLGQARSWLKGLRSLIASETVININKIGGFGGNHTMEYSQSRAAEKLISSDLLMANNEKLTKAQDL